jgi:hypothetical protein
VFDKNSNAAEKSSWRFELKYSLNYMQYQKLKIALAPHMQTDPYTKKSRQKRYLVRSLYYDTYDYSLFHQKMSGDSDRIKFRLRTYTEKPSDDSLIRVEMKVRQANAMEKLGYIVSISDYYYFMEKKHWPDHNSPLLSEFERYLHLKALKPQVLIDYQREGYEDRSREGIRVTFDHRVSSAHSNTLFPDKIFFRQHHPHGVVFEIKCRHNQPYWLRNLVRDYGLKLVANSKFTQGIQVARHDLFHPDGVVIVR